MSRRAGKSRCIATRRNRCSTRPSSMSATPRAEGAGWTAALSRARLSRLVIYGGFLLIFAVFAVVLRDDGFATPSNLLNIVQQTTPVTVMAVGMTFVLTAGEIDLSIGAVVAVAALVAAMVLRIGPWPLGALPGLAAGAGIGPLNRAHVAYAPLPSLPVHSATVG